MLLVGVCGFLIRKVVWVPVSRGFLVCEEIRCALSIAQKPHQESKIFKLRNIILKDSAVGIHAEVVPDQEDSEKGLRAARSVVHVMR